MDRNEIREFIRESNAIERVTSEAALETSIGAWEYLREHDELTHETVQQAHEHILQNRQPDIAGEYRDSMVHIGGEVAPPPEVIHPRMETLIEWVPADSVEVLKWHIAFEHIHPFADGNGRIGRMLYLWQCLDLGITPLIWRAEDKQGYYELFDAEVDISTHTD